MICVRGECVPERVNSGRQELYISYCTVKMCVITSRIMYLLIRIKPADDPLHCSRYTLSRTWGVSRWMVRGISTNTNLFIPNFCIYIIYIYTNKYPQFQASPIRISCPVARSLASGDPGSSHDHSCDHYRTSEFWALN
jgi:hypothetical protein